MQLTEKKGDRVCNCITFWGGGKGKLSVCLRTRVQPPLVA